MALQNTLTGSRMELCHMLSAPGAGSHAMPAAVYGWSGRRPSEPGRGCHGDRAGAPRVPSYPARWGSPPFLYLLRIGMLLLCQQKKELHERTWKLGISPSREVGTRGIRVCGKQGRVHEKGVYCHMDEKKGEISVREAGRRGGARRKQQLGHEGYVALGRKGGDRIRELIAKGREAEEAEKPGK